VRFQLPVQIRDLQRSISEWNSRREIIVGFDRAEWREFLNWGLLPQDDHTMLLASAVGMMEVARHGLPGPMLEAATAAVRSPGARAALSTGAVVTASPPGPSGPTVVAWGNAADMVVDAASGMVLAEGPLPRAATAYVHPHGWLLRVESDPFVGAEIRWCLATALVAGLARGALDLAVRYGNERTQFGRPIGSFQAMQFALAESKVLIEGAYWMAVDCASRLENEDAAAGLSCALGWLASIRVARTVRDTCHQIFGASGLANESRLNELTWGMRWLTQSYDPALARAYLTTHRAAKMRDPGCLVLEGFALRRGDSARAMPLVD
jgi:Acyl-CoA dehydrogenase, C-terminal domain